MSYLRLIRFGGKIVEIDYKSLAPYLRRELDKFLDVYPPVEGTGEPKILITFKSHFSLRSRGELIALNPSTHKELSDGFAVSFPFWGEIFWRRGSAVVVEVYLTKLLTSRNLLFKLIDREFNFPYKYIGALLHELVLVPTVLYFYEGVVPIHGSAIVNINEQVFVFSGSGGVGKTFLEMKLIIEENFGFFSDDVVLIGDDGCTFPNLQFPKIYPYNIRQLPKLADFIGKQHTYFSKIQLNIFSIMPYIGKYYRRCISPKKVSKLHIADVSNLRNFYLLFRTDKVKSVRKKPISSAEAMAVSFDIFKSEYFRIFNHLAYHEANRSLLSMPKLVSESQLRTKYSRIFESLKHVNFILVNIPLDSGVEELYRFIKEDIQ